MLFCVFQKWIEISTRKTKRPPKCELCHFQYIRHKRFKVIMHFLILLVNKNPIWILPTGLWPSPLLPLPVFDNTLFPLIIAANRSFHFHIMGISSEKHQKQAASHKVELYPVIRLKSRESLPPLNRQLLTADLRRHCLPGCVCKHLSEMFGDWGERTWCLHKFITCLLPSVPWYLSRYPYRKVLFCTFLVLYTSCLLVYRRRSVSAYGVTKLDASDWVVFLYSLSCEFCLFNSADLREVLKLEETFFGQDSCWIFFHWKSFSQTCIVMSKV